MTKIDKTDIANIKLIVKETDIDKISTVKIKKGDYEIEISSTSQNIPTNIKEIIPQNDNQLIVNLKLQENQQVSIRKVFIKGNDRTEENVIRRELKIFPGNDLGSYSNGMRS